METALNEAQRTVVAKICWIFEQFPPPVRPDGPMVRTLLEANIQSLEIEPEMVSDHLVECIVQAVKHIPLKPVG